MLNLTPHDIVVQLPGGERRVYPASGQLARVSMEEVTTSSIEIDGQSVEVISRKAGQVTGIPAGVTVLVSGMVCDALKGVPGVYAPDTGATALRNDKGHIVAVTRLVSA